MPSPKHQNAKTPKPHDKQKFAVWKFTNQKELNKSEFINYFERKVFKTIRKFNSLPKDKIFTLKKGTDLNTIILKQILEKKFQVKFSAKPNTKSINLSQASEDIFKNITKGNFNNPQITNAPLIQISDAEIKLYAKLKNIKGTPRKQDKKIQSLFNKFLQKNPDLEINIQKAQNQINETR